MRFSFTKLALILLVLPHLGCTTDGGVVSTITGLELNHNSLTLSVGDTVRLRARPVPADADAGHIAWRSSTPHSVRVDDQGLITVLTAGGSTLSATSERGGYKAACRISAPQQFPDAAFRHVLSSRYGFHLTANGKDIDVKAEANRLLFASTTELNLAGLPIVSLVGIEYFTSLLTLECSRTFIRTLDLSSHPSLQQLQCNRCALTALRLPDASPLKILSCHNNQLAELELEGNTRLQQLDCSRNRLSRLDISANTDLTHLNCADNDLGELNADNNDRLQVLSCSNNYLSTLDLNHIFSLIQLDCHGNMLTRLDIGSTAIETINCSYNQLKELALTNRPSLKKLLCNNALLQQLDLSGSPIFYLDCSMNQLTTLTTAEYDRLLQIDCWGNRLSRLDLTPARELRAFYCGVQRQKELLLILTDIQQKRLWKQYGYHEKNRNIKLSVE